MFKLFKERIRKLKMHYYDYQMAVLTDLMEFYEVKGNTKMVQRCTKDYAKYAKKYMKCMKTYAD